ncbi:tRNA lysidine(34) synthetase TilS, partial [Bacillus cereus]
SYPLRSRSRVNGDRNSIQRMDVTKKIIAFFIEAKLP